MIVHGFVVACRGLAADGLKGPVDLIPGEIRREGGNRAPLCQVNVNAKLTARPRIARSGGFGLLRITLEAFQSRVSQSSKF